MSGANIGSEQTVSNAAPSETLQNVTIENFDMGIHRKTNEAIPSAATLNRRLREAGDQNALNVSARNGYASEAAACMRLWFVDTPIGPALAGSMGDALCLLTFPPDETLREAGAGFAPIYEYAVNTANRRGAPVSCGGPLNDLESDLESDLETDLLAGRLERQLTEWFAGARRAFDLPLALRGTPFQRSVWEALRAIPYAAVRSYGDLAKSLGNPEAVRAVGAANGRNPVAIVVPCHRVIGANGSLTGYAGGVERKRFLLDLEKQNAPQAQGALFGESIAATP